MSIHPVLISVGSNIKPLTNIRKGLGLLQSSFGIKKLSAVWETEAIGPDNHEDSHAHHPKYLNCVVLLPEQPDCLTPETLDADLKKIEAECGRQRGADAYAPRTLDLDLLIFGKQTCDLGRLQIPDPDIQKRSFLAFGLAELCPEFKHPALKSSFLELTQRFLGQKKLFSNTEAENLIRTDLGL